MYLFANWKMNLDKQESEQLIQLIKQGISKNDNITITLFPSAIHLGVIANNNNQVDEFELGCQNISEYDKGAYTGEISINMVSSYGCKYILIGHSERREIYAETNQIVANKIEKTLEYNLIPVVCVGETFEEYKSNSSKDKIASQLQAIIDLSQNEDKKAIFKDLIIAYEPIWAIGTGLASTAEYAEEIHNFIKKYLGGIKENIPVLYGGSVNSENSSSLIKQSSIDGFLVGGASLKIKDFAQIYKNMV